jgi:inner membrane protein
MPSVGHVAVGLIAARLRRAPIGVSDWVWSGTLVILSCLPDADVIAFALGIPYRAPFGHRGAFHSLTFAAFCGAFLSIVARRLQLPASRVGLVGGAVVASHGILDTFTDGGLGIALFWPFTNARYFAPWRPIPVAPIGPRLFSLDGLRFMANECILFLPFFIVGLWPRRRRDQRPGAG